MHVIDESYEESSFELPEIRIESFGKIWGRRLVSISLLSLIFFLFLGLFPFVMCISIITDSIILPGTRWSKSRCIMFFLLYLGCEFFGVIGAFFCWLFFGMRRHSRNFINANRWLQKYWAKALLHGSLKIFSMKLEQEGSESAQPGPFVLLVRHSSVADTVLPANLISNRFDILLRYILKKELLWDPCLDIVGNRLPNVFIDRDSHQSEKELKAIHSLASNLGPKDGLLIYPEGTRYSATKKKRILKKLKEKEKNYLYQKALRYQHVLPPRPNGLKTILDSQPNLDVLVCVHTGFEGAADFKHFFNGRLINKTVKVKFWRIPGNEIPESHKEYVYWLYDLWFQVDQWVDQNIS